MSNKRSRMDSWDGFDNDETAAPAPTFDPVPLDNIMANRHVDCFACLYVNKRSMEQNESYMNMMLMYKDNAFMMAPEALYNLIKSYFDETVRPEMQEALGASADVPDWSLECIREHFTRHTRFPTDELRKQLRSKKAIRDTLNDMIVEMSSTGDKKVRVDYLKELLKLEKEIVALLKSKECISTMLGYSETLNY